MPILVVFLVLFGGLLLFWVVAAGFLVGALFVKAPQAVAKVLEHKEEHCACYLGLMKHHHSA